MPSLIEYFDDIEEHREYLEELAEVPAGIFTTEFTESSERELESV